MYYVNVYEVSPDPSDPRRLSVIRTIRSIPAAAWPDAYLLQRQMKAEHRGNQFAIVIEERPAGEG